MSNPLKLSSEELKEIAALLAKKKEVLGVIKACRKIDY